jgi:hypothetical protein
MENFYMDGYLKAKLDNVKKIISKNWDAVILIDGKERSGKSTLGFACAWYLSEGKITIDNISKDTEDAIRKIEMLPDKSILFVDEGSMSFSSKDAMRREQRKIMKILDVVGQKNLCIIIILPSFFDLTKAIATRRARFLLHVYTDEELNRGRFSYFGEKKLKKLYEYGRKNFGSYDKPEADFIGRFTDFKVPFFEEYLKLKRQTLMLALKEELPILHRNDKWGKQRDCLIKLLYEKRWMSQLEISELLTAKGYSINPSEISKICRDATSKK